ncbi:hypothetical protein ACROYT_G007975 [Oculina patagonica]
METADGDLTGEKQSDGRSSVQERSSAENSPSASPNKPDQRPEQRKTIFTKGKKRKKPDKDLNAPKAPLTGYVRFLNEHREKVRAENQDLPFHEVTKILGNMWSQLPAQQKQVTAVSSIQTNSGFSLKGGTQVPESGYTRVST